MKLLGLSAALLLMAGCAATVGSPTSATTSLDGEALRRLFISGLNTYLAPVRSGDVIVSHPPGELFRPNGTYHRILGRTGLEGWYAIEGDRLCVTGDDIPKQCRKVIPQGGKTYLMIDVSDNSRALMELSHDGLKAPARWLTEVELRTLFSDVRIIPKREAGPGLPVASSRYIETFQRDGTYIRSVDRVRLTGSYIISGPRVCTFVTGEQSRCRRIMIDGFMNYTSLYDDSAVPTIITISK